MNEETGILHERDTSERYWGAVNPLVLRASPYGCHSHQAHLDTRENPISRSVYGCRFNPTRHIPAQKIADVEQADACTAFSLGMGAIAGSLLALLSQGDHLLVVDCVYGQTSGFCNCVLGHPGADVEYFSAREKIDLKPRLGEETRMTDLESPGSLTLDVQHLRSVADPAIAEAVCTVVDNLGHSPLAEAVRPRY
jgi:cystathionine beta-lyase